MRQFKIRPDGFKEIKKKTLIRTAPIILIAVIIGIVISSINSKDKTDEVNVLPIIIPVILVGVGYSLYRGVNRQKPLFDSYTLTFTNNLITREQLNTPTISIYFNEVRDIVKNKNGSFTIRGKEPLDLILIPAQIENYSELENTLNQIKPIETKSAKSFLQQYSLVITLLNLALMLCVYTVTNKIIVAISGAVFVAIMSWSFYEVQRSKNIDAKTKRNMWWALIVLASVIAVMTMKLIGIQQAK